MWSRLRRRIVATLRRDFVAGLLVFVPVGFTILGVLWTVDQLDKLVLPPFFQFLGLEGKRPPFVGVIVTICAILMAGALTRSFIGRSFMRLWESTVERIPVARSIYMVLKQFMEAIIGDSTHASFRRVVLIQYPREGIWSYAFVTGRVLRTPPGLPDGLLKVFVPSTPNPTTGYYLLVPEVDAVETGLNVEEAFKLIISAGMAESIQAARVPPELDREVPGTAASASPTGGPST